ncbi:hypothetical protein BKA80DRAFT_276173 [Phyllosticta citrichinensis]
MVEPPSRIGSTRRWSSGHNTWRSVDISRLRPLGNQVSFLCSSAVSRVGSEMS